jgi:3',5'-cyclic AMP phosphodiesterase CpdA
VTIRIAHLSDIHFGGEIPEAVEAALEAVADFQPTLTVVTGDLTLNGKPVEFHAAAAWLARLPTARMVTPGNHDTPYWNLVLRALTPFDRYRRYIGEAETAAFDAPGLAARCLNSARGAQPRLDWSKGRISIRRLRGLDWAGDGDGPLKVFGCHHPLLEPVDAPVTGDVSDRGQALAALIEAEVDLVLTGHTHIPFALPLTGVEEGGWAIGAGTLSQRLRGTPASFTTILAEDHAFEVVAQGWTGSGFEPCQAWTLPRKSRALRGGSAPPMDDTGGLIPGRR